MCRNITNTKTLILHHFQNGALFSPRTHIAGYFEKLLSSPRRFQMYSCTHGVVFRKAFIQTNPHKHAIERCFIEQ